MIAKKITYEELESAIRIAFEGDGDIYRFYDKNVIVTSLDELVSDIMKKVSGYPMARFKAICYKKKVVGYFVYDEGLLISFALNVKYRTPEHLSDFFGRIKHTINGLFYCHLWSRNIRAVKFLMKQGMQIVDTNPHITKLVNT